MRPRNLLLVLLLGIVVAVLPAMASSETTPAVEAVPAGTEGIYAKFAWSPAQATIGAGGSVMFSTGSTNAPHGIIWTSSVKPTCSSAVPVGEAVEPKEHWSGSCTFAQAGEYPFYCSYHGRAMSGTIIVTAAGATTTMSTPAPTTPTPTATTPTPTPKQDGGPTHPTHLTGAQKLAKALKACKKKPKGKRAACRKRAHRRYGPTRK